MAGDDNKLLPCPFCDPDLCKHGQHPADGCADCIAEYNQQEPKK